MRTSRQYVDRRIACAILGALYTCALVNAQVQESPESQESQESQESDTAHSNAGSVTVSDDGMTELHVADVPLTTALRMLSVRSHRNIIASPAVQGTVSADLYDVTFEEALRAILRANDCDYEARGDLIYVYTAEELAALRAAATPTTHRVFWLNYVTASDVERVIQPLLSEHGSIATSPAASVGIAANPQSAGGDALAGHDFIVVYDYPDRFAEIAAVIKQIDVKPPQVLVEATILRAALTENNALGIDFTTVGGIDFATLQSTSPAAQSITTGDTPQVRLDDTTFTARTELNAAVPAGGFTFGIIKDRVGVFIRALEEIVDTEVLANPKVLALNKQVGNLIVGRRDGYITTTVTETSAVEKIEFLETGTQLTFRPFIGTDGYVRMELHPEDSIGGLTPSELPYEQTTEVTTNVLVRDGHTILIGGLFREVSSDTRAQMPLLGDLPIVGAAFRSRSDALAREEVIILLTVHIIKDDADYARYSAEQFEDIERIRVGLRRGMMWHGRDRLAQTYYRRAVKLFAQGQEGDALWNVRMALHSQPRLLAGIKLKEEIEQTREWDEDGAITRTFIWDLIVGKPGVEVPPFGRPGPPFRRQDNSDAPGTE